MIERDAGLLTVTQCIVEVTGPGKPAVSPSRRRTVVSGESGRRDGREESERVGDWCLSARHGSQQGLSLALLHVTLNLNGGPNDPGQRWATLGDAGETRSKLNA